MPQLEAQYRPRNVNERERIASAILGSVLILFGVRRRSWLGRALAAAGGALIERGASGRCGVYSALRLSSA
ncbi:MAG: YgaP-like transmembrane domain [Polyangia bacterium]